VAGVASTALVEGPQRAWQKLFAPEPQATGLFVYLIGLALRKWVVPASRWCAAKVVGWPRVSLSVASAFVVPQLIAYALKLVIMLRKHQLGIVPNGFDQEFTGVEALDLFSTPQTRLYWSTLFYEPSVSPGFAPRGHNLAFGFRVYGVIVVLILLKLVFGPAGRSYIARKTQEAVDAEQRRLDLAQKID
jgi:hypothetical protein